MKIQNLTKVVATMGKPTLYFLVNGQLKQLVLLDEKNPKRLNYSGFDSFQLATRELIRYEV